jgi:type I restriction enzyme S subunit
VPSLSKKTINDVTVASPSAVEQRQIGAFFASLDDLIALHQRKLTHLQQQKKALLQQMFV